MNPSKSMLKLEVANPHDKTFYDRGYRAMHRSSEAGAFMLTFGAYGDTRVLVYAGSVEDAIEEAAAWLKDNAPGHLMAEDDEHLQELRKEACEDAGLAWPPLDAFFGPQGDDDLREKYYEAFSDAEADLTYTESGWLTSYEWTIDGPLTPKQIADIAHRR